MYEIITNEKVKFQFNLAFSPEAKSICQKLLNKNPKKRISKIGSLKNHKFFKGIDWELLAMK